MRRDQSYVVSACLHELSIKETVRIFPQSIEHIPETLLMFINYSGNFDFVAVEKVSKRNVARIVGMLTSGTISSAARQTRGFLLFLSHACKGKT